jgi:hypothetical protein
VDNTLADDAADSLKMVRPLFAAVHRWLNFPAAQFSESVWPP